MKTGAPKSAKPETRNTASLRAAREKQAQRRQAAIRLRVLEAQYET